MTDEEFVCAVREYVLESAGSDTVSSLADPPGRRPSDHAIEKRDWYNGLDETAKKYISEISQDAAHSALFGLFCVLDGVRLIDEELRDGRLQLIFENEDHKVVLSDNQAFTDLHDLLNAKS